MYTYGFKSLRTYFWDEDCYYVLQDDYAKESYFNTVTVGHVSSPSRLINEDNYFYKE